MSNTYIKNLNGINYTPNLSQINTTIQSTVSFASSLPIISSTMIQDENNLNNYTITIIFTSILSNVNRAILEGFFSSTTPFANPNPQFATVATGICGSVALICNVNSNTLRVQLPAENGTTITTTTSIQQLSGKIINANCNIITTNVIDTVTGILPVIQGGTGISSIGLNRVMIGFGTATITQAINGQVLSTNASQEIKNKDIRSVSNQLIADSFFTKVGNTFGSINVISTLPAATGLTSSPLNGNYLTASIPILANRKINPLSFTPVVFWLYSYQFNRTLFGDVFSISNISNSGIVTGKTMGFLNINSGAGFNTYNLSTGVFTCPFNSIYDISLTLTLQHTSSPGAEYPVEIGIYDITSNIYNPLQRNIYYIPESTDPMDTVAISGKINLNLPQTSQIIPYYSTFTVPTSFNIIGNNSKCIYRLAQQLAT